MGMLVLSRQREEAIMIGDEVEISVVDIRGDKVRLGIQAPRTVEVHRKEVYDAIRKENREAALVSPQAMVKAATGVRGGFSGDVNTITRTAFHSELEHYLIQRTGESNLITPERRAALEKLAESVSAMRHDGFSASLNFICTHNSRRSQMAQIWAAASAAWHGVDRVRFYSGGTESTAFEGRAVAAMRRAGLMIEQTTGDANPVYHVRWDDASPPLTCFSKVFDQAPNPREAFIAVMVCSSADGACPSVAGASKRVSLTYDDPKSADGTPDEAARYDERSAQIAREMLFLFERVRG